MEYEITKYIPYAVNKVSKLITQGKITSYVENSVLPIKNTNIEVNAPKINNKYPETVTVVANSTNATNGDANGDNFSKNNWSYDSTTGKITITVNNNAVNGKIQWAKNTADEFIVTYIYSSDVYEAVKDSVTRVTYDVSSSMNLYVQSGVNKVSAHADGFEDQTKKLGDIVEFASDATKSISKGYIYNNKNAADENKKETEYVAQYTAHVSYADVIDEIVLKQDVDQFVTANGSEQSTTVGGTNYAYNKTLAISKQEFDKLFGENGKVTILNAEGTTLVTINKDTEVKDNKIVVSLVPFNTKSITIKTSKPQAEGNIIFEITKALAKNIEYSTSQLKSFTQIKTSVTGTAKNAETDIVSTENTKNIDLAEPTQKASITTSNNRLSTIVTNENVEIKVTLENDSADDTMYTNPKIKITFPENIETINVKDCKVYFDDELEIDNDSIKSYENNDGTKTLEFKLKGTQTKYNNAAAKIEVAFSEDGSTIVIPINTKVNVYADNDERIVNPREVYIAEFNGNNRVVKQGSDTDPLVFLNNGEENARLDSTSTIESLISAMEDISQSDAASVSRVSLTDVDNGEKDIYALEMKRNRMIAGNEGYYSSIVRLINSDSVSKNEMIPYARKSLGLYSANQRAINKMDSALTRTRDKFNRIKKEFDSKMYGVSE